MGKATSTIDEIRFDLRDPQITHVYVACHGGGDYPLGVDGWYYKAFPARIDVVTIIKEHISHYLLWPLESPQ